MRDLLVYVAGPITHGDLRENLRRACDAGIAILKAGYSALVPHLTCFIGQVYTTDGGAVPEVLPAGTQYTDWYGLSVEEVKRCDAVLRLPGKSTGADLEVRTAFDKGLPVFYCLSDLMTWLHEQTEVLQCQPQ